MPYPTKEQVAAALAHTELQIKALQSRKPQHVISRYGKPPKLPKFSVKLVVPTIPERGK